MREFTDYRHSMGRNWPLTPLERCSMTAHRSLILAVFLTLAPLVGGSVAAAPVVDFTGGEESTANNFSTGDITLGWRFTVTSPIAIGGLGIFDVGANGLANSHQIGLWNSDGSLLLTSATITDANSTHVTSTSTAGDWRSTPLIAPLVLVPADYVIGAFYSDHDADHVFQIVGAAAPGTVSTIPGVTFDESRFALFSFQFPRSHVPGNDGYFGPNLFTVAAPPVPEPKTYAMLMAGLGLLGLIARRRRKSLNAAA